MNYQYNKEKHMLLFEWKDEDFGYEVLGLWTKVRPVTPVDWPRETGN